jgi:uncharacterized protein YndB with AHSA1/START domain
MFAEAAAPIADRELVLTRLIDVPRAKLYRCWTEPQLINQWFCPKPWRAEVKKIDVRSGGSSVIDMHGPDGEKIENRGVYLEVVPNEKISFTDAFVKAWEPSGKPFFSCTVTFADEAGQTRYVARAQHWSAEDCQTHEKMGFYDGWGVATDQLTALAKTL